MEIILPDLRTLSDHAAQTVLEQATVRHPNAVAARLKLAALLINRDAFDEAVVLLDQPDQTGSSEHALLLAQALLGRLATGDAERAISLADHAAEQALDTAVHNAARLTAARALLRSGREGEGEAALRELLASDVQQLGAFRSLTDRLLRLGKGAEVLALVDAAQNQGLQHARALGAKAAVAAQSGALEFARELAGLDRFVMTRLLAAPSGWNDLLHFNSALRAEAEGDPDLRRGRHGTASRQTLRVDHPLRADTTAFQALHRLIATVATQHISSLEGNHPWLAARPDRLIMRSWCVMTDANGFEEWHNHPAGWMSGGYYLAMPEPDDDVPPGPGCLAFGFPPTLVGAANAAAIGERLITPAPGMLALFPSHAYHRTYPHGRPRRRICLAFDLVPA